ncbi:MAG: 3-phosphoserine/phosphohydroxythreonine transaminase, partial [Bacteroidales bacterium]|nr:3-phosphoserine/phosphohydroxythreonine transaminase [Bacteroidales bacterium]
SKEFDKVVLDAQDLFKELLEIPEGYSVIFLGGGASMQFAMIPYNFLKKKAAYINTGTWASNALKEAKLFGDVQEIKADDFFHLPKNISIDKDADYVHITTNNTIYGTEFKEDFDFGVPLIADMSSDIFSRKVDVSKYDMIYGGAQKNLAPAGVTFVIVKDDILGKVERPIPTMLNYKTHVDKGSMFNTPPVIPIYSAYQTLLWMKENGGVDGMHKRAVEKADLLYNEIDRNPFFVGTVEKESRSIMNICFVMSEQYKDKDKDFLDFATQKGMIGIKGHRSVGGFRASTYNSLPLESVAALVEAMQEFEKMNK